MLNKHLANSDGGGGLHSEKPAGRSGRIIMSNEARVLRDLRLQAGLSMRKAGALLGYTDSYISHIENGRSDVPTGNRLDRFLAIYGGIKQKSFYERVRNYQSRISPSQELLEIIRGLSDQKIKILVQLAKTF